MEPHNSIFAKIRGTRFAPPMAAMPHPTLFKLKLIALNHHCRPNVDISCLKSRRYFGEVAAAHNVDVCRRCTWWKAAVVARGTCCIIADQREVKDGDEDGSVCRRLE